MGNCNSVDVVQEDIRDEKPNSQGDASEEANSDGRPTDGSLFEVNAYKSTLKRIENGDKMVEYFINFLETRAEVEEAYTKKLNEWDQKWKKNATKCDPFAENVFTEIMPEAKFNAEIHKCARHRLKSDIEALKDWRKEHYPKKLFGGLKETENLEKQFKEVTQPYQQALQKVELDKKKYHDTCNKLSATQCRLEATSNDAQANEEVRSLENQKDLTKAEYENSINSLAKIYPVYEQKISTIFKRIQDIERQRMNYTKELARRYIGAINLTDTKSLDQEYQRIQTCIENFSPDDIIDEWNGSLISLQNQLPKFEEGVSTQISKPVSNEKNVSEQDDKSTSSGTD